MRRGISYATLGSMAALMLLAAAPAPSPVVPPAAVASAGSAFVALPGYLSGRGAPDTVLIIPPPPAEGSPGEARNRAAFDITRALRGTPRWDLATADVDLSLDAILADFSCALGFLPTNETTPQLIELIRRSAGDGGAASGQGELFYKLPRPYVRYASTDICVVDSPELRASADYPSGHAAIGFAVALVLAEVAPERATEILARGRIYGESRVVCGVHTPAAVEASRTAVAAFVAVMHANPAFQADIVDAKEEVAALRKQNPADTAPAASCSTAAAIGAKTPWDLTAP